HWLIEIEDQGPGFTPADLSHIYEKYAKLSAQPTGDENSTGLGLAIVNHLTRLLGLNLNLQTQMGTGTCFSLCLPKVKDATGSIL
ncbi:MAG: sensor histidine kinase, partial [Candidatus Sericytochromatia bacterium]